VNALCLVLSDDDVSDGGSWQQVEDSIRVSALSLLIAAAFGTLVTLHPAIKDLSRHDVLGILEDHCLLCHRELCDGEREARGWPLAKVSLSSVTITLTAITSLGLTRSNDGGLSNGGEERQKHRSLHCVDGQEAVLCVTAQ
jgi:hypothetical protein